MNAVPTPRFEVGEKVLAAQLLYHVLRIVSDADLYSVCRRCQDSHYQREQAVVPPDH